jgi:hypothetical protein
MIDDVILLVGDVVPFWRFTDFLVAGSLCVWLIFMFECL